MIRIETTKDGSGWKATAFAGSEGADVLLASAGADTKVQAVHAVAQEVAGQLIEAVQAE